MSDVDEWMPPNRQPCFQATSGTCTQTTQHSAMKVLLCRLEFEPFIEAANLLRYTHITPLEAKLTLLPIYAYLIYATTKLTKRSHKTLPLPYFMLWLSLPSTSLAPGHGPCVMLRSW